MEKLSPLKIHIKHLIIIFLICSAFYLAFFKDDPMIDFVPLYTVGHIWRNSAGAFYYDYQLVDFAQNGAVFESSDEFDHYARTIGYNDKKNKTTLFIYYPAFIPLFSVLSVLPFLWMKKIFILLSVFTLIYTLKSIAENILIGKSKLLVFFAFIIPIFFSSIFQWSIGAGQFTPYLFAGTWFALICQQRGKYLLAGFLLAGMTWFKFFPGILIFIWFLEKDFKSIASFVFFFLLIFASAFLIFDAAVVKDYFILLKQFGSRAPLIWVNQSIDSFLMRFCFPIQNSGEPVGFLLLPQLKILTLLLKAILLLSWFYFTKQIILIKSEIKTDEISMRESAYYLLAVCILLFPIAWLHYFIYFIPLTIWILRYESDVRLKSSIVLKLILAVSFIMLFMNHNILSYPVIFLIKTFGKNTSAFAAKILLSCHLLGGILLLILAQIKIKQIAKTLTANNPPEKS